VQGQQLAKPAPKAVRRHSKIVYFFLDNEQDCLLEYLSENARNKTFCVLFHWEKKKEDSFTYLLKKCKIYSTGNKNCLREE